MNFMDERMGVTSSSSMPRVMNCLGSFLFEKQQEDTRSAYVLKTSKRGDKIHAALAGHIPLEKLSKSDFICYERCSFEEGRLVQEHGFEGAQVIREERLKLEENGRVYHTGKPDVVHFFKNKALIINYKTGHLPVENPAVNWQCVSEAILVAHNFKATSLIGVVIHPYAPLENGAISQVYTYSSKQIEAYGNALKQGAFQALVPIAPRTPGEWCTYCRGAKNKTCPEWLSIMEHRT